MIEIETLEKCQNNNSNLNIITINNIKLENCLSVVEYNYKEIIKIGLLRHSFFDLISIIFLVLFILLLWTNERINKDSKEHISIFGNK